MATRVRVSIFILVLLIFPLATLYRSSHSHEISINDGVVYTGGSIRSLLSSQRSVQIPNCSEMVSKLQCSQKPKCRWCKSDVLDDMCFCKLEAWRLPQQFFPCV